MAAQPAVSACSARSSADWLLYFQSNASEPTLPWRDLYHLSEDERRAVSASIRQFQLGESGQGRRLLRQAERWAARREDLEYLEALRLFIQEEQRHSRYLGRFLELQRIPCMTRHWVDGAFRRIRGLAGMELRMRVLATAEVLAMPYYSALREATRSPLLRAMCGRILEDEIAHLRFQAFTFGLLRGGRSGALDRMVWKANRILLAGATAVLWREHKPVFLAAGYTRSQLRAEAARWFAELQDA